MVQTISDTWFRSGEMNCAEQKEHIKGEIRIHWFSIIVLLLLIIIVIFLMVWTWCKGGRVFIIFWCAAFLIFACPIRPLLKEIKKKKRIIRRIDDCEKWEDST